MRRLLTGILAALTIVSTAEVLRAQTFENCRSNDAINPDVIVQTCTAAIRSGRLSRPLLALAHNYRGLAYQRQKDYDRAIVDFGVVVKTDPKFVAGYANLANTWWLKGDIQRAAENVEAGLRLTPQNPFLYFMRGQVAAGRGSLQSAISDYTRAFELKSDFALALVNRGDAYVGLAQLDQGCADYESALKIDGRSSFAYSGRSGCLLERRNIDEALTAANVAIALNSENANGYSARGRAYRAKREFDKAIADFDMAIRLRPNSANPLTSRAMVWRALQQHDKAIEDLTASLRIDPTNTAAYTERGLAYLAKGDIEAGRKDLQAAVDRPPKYFYGKRAQEAARSRLALLSSGAAPATEAAPQAKPAERRVALVIGNGRYAHATHLPNPSNDARAIGAALRDLGFEVIEGIDLGRSMMEQHLRDFLQRSSSARIALMFYAGHGMQVDGRNYLVPVDARLAARTDLDADTVDLDKIVAALDDEIRANIIMLDACRDNPLAQLLEKAARSRSIAPRGGLAAYSSVGTGTLIAFATAPGHVAQDGDGANSPFTTALLKHIRTADLEVRQMMTRVRAEVAAATGRKQIPWDNSSLLGDIYLARQN